MTIIVYLNRDAFAVPRAAYFAKVAQARGDWTIVTEWIEAHGTYLGRFEGNTILPFTTEDSVSHLPD